MYLQTTQDHQSTIKVAGITKPGKKRKEFKNASKTQGTRKTLIACQLKEQENPMREKYKPRIYNKKNVYEKY